MKYRRGKKGRPIKKKNMVKRLLEEADVVLATCAGAADPGIFYPAMKKKNQKKVVARIVC